MTITHNLKIDLVRPAILPPVTVVQGDTYTREVQISLYAAGVAWELPEGHDVAIRYSKSDGTAGVYDTMPDGSMAWQSEGNTVNIMLCPQMLTAPGMVPTQVSIIMDERTLSTFTFLVAVEPDAGKGALASENYYNWRTAFLPQITGAKPGQYLRIAEVDEQGWVVALEAVDAPEGGGDPPVAPGSHSVVWNLVNVNSSNSITSIYDGASLVAVLTAVDGYILGDVIVTMGGEALTGAWNADTATITITSVTGDVVISCAGVEQTGPVDTSPAVNYDNSYTKGASELGKGSFAFVTEFTVPSTLNSYAIAYCTPYKEGDGGIPRIEVIMDGTYVTSWSQQTPLYSEDGNTSATASISKQYGDFNTIRMTIYKSCQDYSYAYWRETGEIIFAGKLSPYYGMADIYGTPAGGTSPASELSVDDDYAMDYGVSVAALVTDDAATASGALNTGFAEKIEDAKNEWLSECNGNIDKIPLIIHTDQHGSFNNSLWDFIAKIVDWHDVGKVINLGDTVNSYDGDILSNSSLESYVDSMKSVPYSKRIEVFGNHDIMTSSDEGTGKIVPQNYLYKYFRNIYARRADNYGNFVTYDNNYNVKYLAVAGFACDSNLGGYTHYIINPDTIPWIVAELEKADGYDVVILSHVPLNQNGTAIDPTTGANAQYGTTYASGLPFKKLDGLWGGRKNKTAGTFTDEYGNEYTYDFTKCNGDLLCSLHGHQHEDSYYYTDDTLLSACFDAYYIAPNAIHFVIVDRENRRLNVWKVDSTPQYQNYQIPLDKPTE